MRHYLHVFLSLALLTAPLAGATKPHVISFGKWTAIKWFVGPDESNGMNLKVRALFVDGHLKEFTLGIPHEVTDRLLVVRRVFRVNDILPEESGPATRWRWQRGGWLLLDRITGRVTQINLPEFDPYYSAANWYRDYVAYCGVSDDGKKLYAIVAQLGRRKPVLKKPLGEATAGDAPDSECPAPAWQRQPTRVTFEPKEDQKLTYAIRGHAVDLINDNDEEEEAASK
jgi:hypothetical protein